MPSAETFRVPSPLGAELELFVVHQPPAPGTSARGAVLYVHGATFASGLAVGFKLDGTSWMDDLAHAGFDAWTFDFHGYGGSSRYPEMAEAAAARRPLGRAPVAMEQIDAVVRFIRDRTGRERVHMVAHSWGTQPTGLFAARHPEQVDRLVLFAPILRRKLSHPPPDALPAYRFWTVAEQWQRFIADVPKNHPPVLLKRHVERWGRAYLATDPGSGTRTPPAVRTPAGPAADILASWSGALPYEPAAIRAATLVVRGEWDSLCTDADARWLRAAWRRDAVLRNVKIAQATHQMHLEEGRFGLYRATREFLAQGEPR